MKTAVVTGAGRGLGRLIARGIAAKGYAVLATDIDGDAAQATAELIGGDAWAMTQDVRDAESHRQVAAAAANRGELSVWVNNAGVLHTGALWSVDEAALQRQIDVNVLGLIWGSRAAIAEMRVTGGGHIINMGSISSLVPAPGMAVYSASKHAVLGFSISLQGDLRREGLAIDVSVMCPDVVATEMIDDNADVDEASLLFASKQLLDADDVARRVVDLVDRPSLVQVLPFHRGVLAHALRPFPAIGLRILEAYTWIGERNRRRRG
jgi:short-subunit dehydrogenase